MIQECKKTKYASAKWALLDIDRINKKSTRYKLPIRAYLCQFCGAWHITSEEYKANKNAK